MAGSFIETFTGQAFYPLAPKVEDIRLGDIAHALSQQCRFAGHTREFYSVAEHCVRVCRYLKEAGAPKNVQLWGLLHDASEAYLVDIPSPLKRSKVFKTYRESERKVMARICERYDLPLKQPEAVTYADQVLLATEARDLMPFVRTHWRALKAKPLEDRIVPWSPLEAETRFLRTITEL